MIRIFKLVMLLVISQVAFGQAPSNYVNINGRYRWIAGMFDSTFHIPKGSTPSLRTGGSTNSGGLFYRTSDSSVYTYTGTQWIKLRGSINPSDTTNKYVTQVYKKNASDSVFYVKGGNHLFAFIDSVGSPGGGGGGKVYYFNGGVSMGTFGGFAMYELGDTANTGAAANFTRSTTGNIANFITDPGKPGLLQIPAGVWSVDAWLSETGGGANHAEIWVEVEKWDGSTITTIATSPIEQITEGATPNLYSWSVSIPTTSLTVTDRIIIQFYISNTNGKTVTLYTQNGYVGEVHTTFTTGIGAINGLTTPAQYLVTGTSGTDFNINSSTATHTFNLPTASSMIRGALSPTDWSAFNNKIGPSDTASMLSPYFRLAGVGLKNTGQTVYADTLLLSTRAWRQKGIDSVVALINSNVSGTTNYVAKFTGSNTIGNSQIIDNGTAVGIGTAASNAYKLSVAGIYRGVGVGDAARIELYDTQAGGATFFVNPQQSLGVTSLGTYGAYPISFVTNNSERMRLDASGNLGIGTSSPASKLAVVGEARVYTGSSLGYWGVDAGNSYVYFGTNTSNYGLSFQTSGAEKMRLDASGNLGLGVSPSAWASGWKALQIGKTTSIADNDFGDVYLLANAYYDGSSTRYIATGFNATYYGQENGAHIWLTAPSGTAGNAISFTQAMTLFSTGNLAVGGTSDNGYKLDVNGTGRFSGALTGTTASFLGSSGIVLRADVANGNNVTSNTKIAIGTNGQYGTIANKKYLDLDFVGFNNYPVARIRSWDEAGSTGYGSLYFYTNGSGGTDATTLALKLNYDGAATFSSSVTAGGIITGQVNGNTFGTASATGRAVIIQAGSANQAIQFKNALGGDGTLYATGDATSMNYAFNTYSTGDALVIKNNGSVGIGTTSPSGNGVGGSPTILQVNNSSTSVALFSLSNQDNSNGAVPGVLDFVSGGLSGADKRISEIYAIKGDASTSTPNGSLVFATANSSSVSERMRITSGGNVGIGTTNPSAPLTVTGNISLGNRASSGTSYIGKLREDNGGISNAYGIGFVNSDINGAGYINFYTTPVGGSGDTRMTITGSGNVGIGTTSPSEKLDLQGTMNMNGASGTYLQVQYNGGNRGYLGTANATIASGATTDFGISATSNLIFGTGGSLTERMRITSGGNVFIGSTTTINSERLFVKQSSSSNLTGIAVGYGTSANQFRSMSINSSNDMTFNNGTNEATLSSAGTWTNASDSSIKKEIIPIKYGLNDLMQLKPRSYKMKANDLEQIGFIAQEVENVIPEVVITNDNGAKGLSYGNMVSLLVQAIKDLKAEIETLKIK